jgi:predicted transcriptional regulator
MAMRTKMSDGRQFTNYLPCPNNAIKMRYNIDINDEKAYRAFLKNNSLKIMADLAQDANNETQAENKWIKY